MKGHTTIGLKRHIGRLWQGFSEEMFPKAERFCVEEVLDEREKKLKSEARKHLSPWIQLTDEAIHVLIQTDRLVRSSLFDKKGPDLASLHMCTSRMVGLAISVRKLVLLGMEDAARPLMRALHETMDIALAALGHSEFRQAIVSEDEEDRFWEKYIAYGRVYKYVRASLSSLGIADELIEDLITSRREAKTVLSGSVHAAVGSLFRSAAVPSLTNPGMLSLTPLGELSAHSPGLLSGLVVHTQRFGFLIVQMITNGQIPDFLAGIETHEQLDSFAAAYMTLQGLVQEFEDSLPPPFIFPGQDIGQE